MNYCEKRLCFFIFIQIYEGQNLLEVPARNVGEYARNLLKTLFKPSELQSSLLPSQHSKKFAKSELDQHRIDLLNGNLIDLNKFLDVKSFFPLDAVRTRYRITKHHYLSFYKDRIQETLANCVYNEGVRKPKRQAAIQQQKRQEEVQQQQSQSCSTAAFD